MTTVEEVSAVESAQKPAAATRLATGMIGPMAVVAALLSALTTCLVLANLTFVSPTYNVVVTLLAVNFVTVLLLLAIIGREVWHIIQARRRGSAGARLHIQIAILFSAIAVAPAVLVAVVASINLDRGLDRLFLIRTRAVMENSVIVSNAYLKEHERSIQAETNFMASDVAKAQSLFEQDIDRFRQGFTTQALLRNMPTAMMLRSDQSVIVKADIRLPPEVQDPPLPPVDRLGQIGDAEAVAGMLRDTNYIGGLIKLKGYDDAYLFVARFIDPRVLEQIQRTENSIQEYADLEVRRIGAANLVSTGNLHVQVPVRRSEGDLSQLGATFNKMTQELRTQRNDIMRARDLVDSRRRFTEAVLAGASAGVIGVDGNGHVSILTRSAEKLIGSGEAQALGHPLEEIVPELKQLIEPARLGGQRLVQGQTTINRNGRDRTVSVRVTSEQSANPDHGYVVTLDDITELVTAQRTAAWADIARRIAHEIKNPLTPIQLSAERLRRKYGNSIVEDKAVFEQCTDTIVRQVGDIGRMVDEFSRFARMPKPVIAPEDVAETVRQVVFMMRVAHPDIDIDIETG